MKYTNKFNLPKSLTDLIDNLTYDRTKNDPNRIWATSLVTPFRISLLTNRHWNELEEDYSNYLWRIAGNAYHYVLAKTKKEDRVIEEKIETLIEDLIVVSRADIYEENNKSIEDWKFTSVWSVKDENKEWEVQLNIYAWAFRKKGKEVDKLYINAILRDWRKAESKKNTDYPLIPFIHLPIKLWSFEEQDKFITDKIKLYKSIVNLPDDQLPLCTSEERWAVPDKYAIYKNKNKIATIVVDSEEKANGLLKKFKDNTKDKYFMKKRPGKDNRCCDYCGVNKYCDYWKTKYGYQGT